jgi:hypothetical protein
MYFDNESRYFIQDFLLSNELTSNENKCTIKCDIITYCDRKCDFKYQFIWFYVLKRSSHLFIIIIKWHLFGTGTLTLLYILNNVNSYDYIVAYKLTFDYDV